MMQNKAIFLYCYFIIINLIAVRDKQDIQVTICRTVI